MRPDRPTVRLLVSAEVRQRRRTIASLAVGTFVFLLAIAGTYEAFGGAAGLGRAFGAQTPSFFSAFAGARDADIFAPASFVAFGFAHPLFLVLTLTVGIGSGTASVAGDVESGRSEMLYTRPLRRTAILDARVLFWLAAQTAVVTAGVAGSYLGTRLSPDLHDVGIAAIARVGTQYMPLALFLGATSFAASAFARTRGQALGIAIGVSSLTYLVNFIALLWKPLAWTQRLSPFGYYVPLRSVERFDAAAALVLIAGTALLLIAARRRLERRDLV
ncbi:MAG: ABC transporter permease [Acidimicrobiia bacterium]|nr:ABC transporter permease [Acidimicrobiia bacterium]